MFASSGYFRGADCPYFAGGSGLCERVYCHFRHVKVEEKPKPNVTHDVSAQKTTEGSSKEGHSSSLLSHLGGVIKQCQRDIEKDKAQLLSLRTSSGVQLKPHSSLGATVPLYRPTPIASLSATTKDKQGSNHQHHKKAYLPASVPAYNPTPIHLLQTRRSSNASEAPIAPVSGGRITLADAEQKSAKRRSSGSEYVPTKKQRIDDQSGSDGEIEAKFSDDEDEDAKDDLERNSDLEEDKQLSKANEDQSDLSSKTGDVCDEKDSTKSDSQNKASNSSAKCEEDSLNTGTDGSEKSKVEEVEKLLSPDTSKECEPEVGDEETNTDVKTGNISQDKKKEGDGEHDKNATYSEKSKGNQEKGKHGSKKDDKHRSSSSKEKARAHKKEVSHKEKKDDDHKSKDHSHRNEKSSHHKEEHGHEKGSRTHHKSKDNHRTKDRESSKNGKDHHHHNHNGHKYEKSSHHKVKDDQKNDKVKNDDDRGNKQQESSKNEKDHHVHNSHKHEKSSHQKVKDDQKSDEAKKDDDRVNKQRESSKNEKDHHVHNSHKHEKSSHQKVKDDQKTDKVDDDKGNNEQESCKNEKDHHKHNGHKVAKSSHHKDEDQKSGEVKNDDTIIKEQESSRNEKDHHRHEKSSHHKEKDGPKSDKVDDRGNKERKSSKKEKDHHKHDGRKHEKSSHHKDDRKNEKVKNDDDRVIEHKAEASSHKSPDDKIVEIRNSKESQNDSKSIDGHKKDKDHQDVSKEESRLSKSKDSHRKHENHHHRDKENQHKDRNREHETKGSSDHADTNKNHNKVDENISTKAENKSDITESNEEIKNTSITESDHSKDVNKLSVKDGLSKAKLQIYELQQKAMENYASCLGKSVDTFDNNSVENENGEDSKNKPISPEDKNKNGDSKTKNSTSKDNKHRQKSSSSSHRHRNNSSTSSRHSRSSKKTKHKHKKHHSGSRSSSRKHKRKKSHHSDKEKRTSRKEKHKHSHKDMKRDKHRHRSSSSRSKSSRKRHSSYSSDSSQSYSSSSESFSSGSSSASRSRSPSPKHHKSSHKISSKSWESHFQNLKSRLNPSELKQMKSDQNKPEHSSESKSKLKSVNQNTDIRSSSVTDSLAKSPNSSTVTGDARVALFDKFQRTVSRVELFGTDSDNDADSNSARKRSVKGVIVKKEKESDHEDEVILLSDVEISPDTRSESSVQQNTLWEDLTTEVSKSDILGKMCGDEGSLPMARKRKAHSANPEALVRKKSFNHSTPRMTPAQIMTSRFESAQKAPETATESTSTATNSSETSTVSTGKKRTAHAANIPEPRLGYSLLKRRPSVPAPATEPTKCGTVAKDTKRIAHVPAVKVIKRPIVLAEPGSRVPTNIRQRYLNLFIDEFLSIYPLEEDAYERAVGEEKQAYARASNKNIYFNLCVHSIKKLRDEKDTKTNGVQLTSPTKQVSHAAVLGGKAAANNNYSVKKPTLKLPDKLAGPVLYKLLLKYILTEDQQRENCYPQSDPDMPGCAKLVIPDRAKNKTIPNKLEDHICCRCGKRFTVFQDGTYARQENCIFHWGKSWKRRIAGSLECRYTCCEGDSESNGCEVCKYHVSEHNKYRELSGYVKTKAKSMEGGSYGVYSMDCEMVYTTKGCELARVTVIDADLQVVYEALVKPENEIVDYNTRFSGLTEKDMKGVQTTLRDVQSVFLSMFSDKTILMGHSLESDLISLKIIHNTVVDTSVVFPHRLGPPLKRALKTLMAEFLQKIIQNDEGGHDSKEDASACMELMLWKVKQDAKKILRS